VVLVGQAKEGAAHHGLRYKEGSQRETGESGRPEHPEHWIKR
jgi:hypothetical protein